MQRFPEALAHAITAVDETLDALGAGGPLDTDYVEPVFRAQSALAEAALASDAVNGPRSVEPLGGPPLVVGQQNST